MNTTIGFSVPVKDAEKLLKLVQSARTQYNIVSDKRCKIGDAYKFLIELGYEEFVRKINEKNEQIKDKKRKIDKIKKDDGLRVEESIE